MLILIFVENTNILLLKKTRLKLCIVRVQYKSKDKKECCPRNIHAKRCMYSLSIIFLLLFHTVILYHCHSYIPLLGIYKLPPFFLYLFVCCQSVKVLLKNDRLKLNLSSICFSLSFLFFVSIWEYSIIVSVLSLALGFWIPSNGLYNTLTPIRFQIEWFKICKTKQIVYVCIQL